jgi:hypothetical protein
MYNEEAVRDDSARVNMINQVSDDSVEEVKQLVEEGFDSFSRRH